MTKRHKVVLKFEDLHGDKMDLFLVEESDRVRVWARHTRRKIVNEGATSLHASLKTAEAALAELEKSVRDKGWTARVKKKHEDDPAPMKQDASGNRLFRDAVTGQYVPDNSASNPPKVPLPDTTPPSKPKKEPEFQIDTLPKP